MGKNKSIYIPQKTPVEISLDVPNTETLSVIDDVNHGRNLSKSFHSVTELL